MAQQAIRLRGVYAVGGAIVRAGTPIFNKLAGFNVDDHPATASRYGIRGIPNLIILKGGAVKEQIVGAVPKAKLVSAIEKALL